MTTGAGKRDSSNKLDLIRKSIVMELSFTGEAEKFMKEIYDDEYKKDIKKATQEAEWALKDEKRNLEIELRKCEGEIELYKGYRKNIFIIILGVLFIPLCFGWGILWVGCGEYKRTKGYYKKYSKERAEILSKIENLKMPPISTPNADKIKKSTAYLRSLKPKIEAEIKRGAEAVDKKVKPMKRDAEKYYNALVKQFSPLLDERDWRNVDLIIYYLETRRADTIKEALQLMDRELQTQRLEKAIAEAAQSICSALYSVAAGIRQTIESCCGIISAQLSTVNEQFMNVNQNMVAINSNISQANKSLLELADGQRNIAALQAKANLSSAQLADDVNRLRKYEMYGYSS